jgi:hypothetical protein
MKRIKTFNQLFEAAKMHEDCEEFFRITKGTEELKQIETLDIWEHEKKEYFNSYRSDEQLDDLRNKLEDLIIKRRKNSMVGPRIFQ